VISFSTTKIPNKTSSNKEKLSLGMFFAKNKKVRESSESKRGFDS
jgi:hypothetical protein